MEWISVKDRLPESTGNYLVFWDTCTSREFPNICSKYDVLYYARRWWAPDSEKNPVTHWMPLPSPPKESKDG